jgi:hypothetical protein
MASLTRYGVPRQPGPAAAPHPRLYAPPAAAGTSAGTASIAAAAAVTDVVTQIAIAAPRARRVGHRGSDGHRRSGSGGLPGASAVVTQIAPRHRPPGRPS